MLDAHKYTFFDRARGVFVGQPEVGWKRVWREISRDLPEADFRTGTFNSHSEPAMSLISAGEARRIESSQPSFIVCYS